MLKLTDKTLLCSQLYIDGAWVDADNGGRWSLLNPATEDEITELPFGDASDVEAAIDAAHAPHSAPGYGFKFGSFQISIARR